MSNVNYPVLKGTGEEGPKSTIHISNCFSVTRNITLRSKSYSKLRENIFTDTLLASKIFSITNGKTRAKE